MKKVKQSKEVLVADFPDSKVVFDLETYVPHILNRTAADIWDYCKKPKEPGKIMDFLCKKYDIDIKTARKDVRKVIKGFLKNNLMREVP